MIMHKSMKIYENYLSVEIVEAESNYLVGKLGQGLDGRLGQVLVEFFELVLVRLELVVMVYGMSNLNKQ